MKRRTQTSLRRRLNAAILVFALILTLVPFSGSAAGAKNAVNTSARAHVLLEATSGRVMSEHNSSEKLPMASTTKIMTCLLACERGNMDDVVTVGAESVGLDGTSIYLRQGETITLRELCYGLMLCSGNDAAMAIAVHLGGSQEGFAKLMNERARQIGAYNTNFVTPNGLPAEGHYTTAMDLALIAAQAMQNELFKEIVGTSSMTLEADEDSPVRYLKSKNKILYNYDGGNGVKTGYTKAAGKCLVAGASRDGMQLIAVVLNDYSMFPDCMSLLDYGFENYKWTDVTGQTLLHDALTVENGLKYATDAVIKDEIYLPLNENDSKIKINYRLQNGVNAPISRGDVVGSAQYSLNGEVLREVPIYAAEDVGENTYRYWLERVLTDWLGAGRKAWE